MKVLKRTDAKALEPHRLAIGLAIALSLGGVLAQSAVEAAALENVGPHLQTDLRTQARDRLSRGHRATQRSLTALPDRPAATIPVANCNDTGPGSLRAAVNASVSGDTIDLTQLACSTITLTSGGIVLADDLIFQGPGVDALTISAGNASNVFNHFSYGSVEFANLSIAHGYDRTPYNASGACIFSFGSVFLYQASVSDCVGITTGNARIKGGAVYAYGNVIMIGSTVSHGGVFGNGAGNAYGGGVYAEGDFFSKYSTIRDSEASAVNGGGFGGGLWVLGASTIARSTISGNTAQTTGGAVLINRFNATDNVISESTISNNYASSSITGAGVFSKSSIAINTSTITGNVESTIGAGKYGAGLCLYGPAQANLQSTIISGNFKRSGLDLLVDDINGDANSTLSGSHNLLGFSFLAPPADTLFVDPQLEPLDNYGGPTQTHALLAGSPAIDAGSNPDADSTDQRGPGFPRVRGSAADIGAFEFQPTVLGPPTVAKGFLPAAIQTDAVSTLTITLGNANAVPATLAVALTDTLPPSMVIASPPNASTSCVAGNVTADAGSGSVSLAASAEIPSSGSCSVSVDVTAAIPGVFTNTIAAGDLQTDAGSNPAPATADLTVSAVPIAPTLTKAFSPAIIEVNGVSTLTLVLANINAADATLIQPLTDTLPTPLVVAALADATTTCADGVVDAVAGAGSVSLGSGARIPAGGTCMVSVSVTAAAEGSFINLIDVGALQTDAGSNADPATATLTSTATSDDLIFADGFEGP